MYEIRNADGALIGAFDPQTDLDLEMMKSVLASYGFGFNPDAETPEDLKVQNPTGYTFAHYDEAPEPLDPLRSDGNTDALNAQDTLT